MRQDTRLALKRHAIKEDPGEKVRIGTVFVDGQPFVGFECSDCDLRVMVWNDSNDYWECPECGYELTPAEAHSLLGKTLLRMALMRESVEKVMGQRRGVRWGLANWLLRRLLLVGLTEPHRSKT